MDVSAIVARLDAQCPALAQVLAAAPRGTVMPIATQANIYALLQGTVSGRMYPLQLPEQPTHPSIVYQMVSSSPGVFEGFDVTHTDVFVLSVRGYDYDALLSVQSAMVTALSGSNIDITDMVHEYDQPENLYKLHLELSYTYIAAASQTLPAAFVYPLSRYGEASAFDNYTKQLVQADYAVLIVTADNNIPALQAEIQAALLGWQQSANHHEMEYSNGTSIEGMGGLSMWRESYRDKYYMTQS
jgi:hypothetical protein